MMIATAVVLAAVSMLLIVSVQSLQLGLISLLPNLLPFVITFGLWGYFVAEGSFAATIVATLTFGIVVDDTVHIILKYQRAPQLNPDPREAIA
ncbi:MAG: hypothetical protein ACR2PG_21185 [Hyphomicrobiaceae bacterium]